MQTYTFTLVLDGPALSEDYVDRLYAAGCDDASFGGRGTEHVAEFDREAPTLAAALLSAIEDIEGDVPEYCVLRVEPDDLVNASVIAERTGRSRESIRLLAKGERGEGDFPKPVTWLDGNNQIWRWGEVAAWFEERGEAVGGSAGGAPQFIAALNGVLETRQQLAALSRVASDESAPTLAFTVDTVGALPALLTAPTKALVRELVASD
jgi:predicted DNA-binding transcriptional regulator AlpA